MIISAVVVEVFSNNPIWNKGIHSQRRRNFTNSKISSYNQLETVLCDNVFNDTRVGTTTADELNCFCRMLGRRGVLSLISSRDHCQRFSPSQIPDMPRAEFEPAQSLSSGSVE